MRSTIMRAGAVALALAALTAGCANRGGATEDAADYPSGDIKLIVPYDAGGASDLAARTLASGMQEELGQDIIVENRTGGAGAVGLEDLAGSANDGYTLGYLPVETTMLGHQGYDTDPADYDVIGQMVSVPATVAVAADSPYETLDDLIAAAEEDPGEITVGNSGAGSIWEAATMELGEATGTEFQPVPFDGGAPAVTAVRGGQVDAVIAGVSETSPAHNDGELRVLAVLDDEVPESLDGVETAADQGVDVQIGGWGGIGVPAGTPDEVREILEDAVSTAAESEDFTSVINSSGDVPVNVPADEFAQFIEEEQARFESLLQDQD